MSDPATRKMSLGIALQPFGCHRASWRHPRVPRNVETDFNHHLRIARRSEQGLFDFLFMGDSLSAILGEQTPATLGRQPPTRALDPLMLCTALASVTSRIGLIPTINTTYGPPPFVMARMLSSLDHISGGRAGWNLVTGSKEEEAPNFTDRPHMAAPDRYARAVEYAEIMFGLWNSWDADAFVCDRESGLYFDPAKMHLLEHHGEYFHVRGPLMTPRSPQGRPITVQAGNSDDGRDLAAGIADLVFAIATSLDSARLFYKDIKDRAARRGRNPSDVRIMPGVQVFVGRTRAEAQDKLAVMEASYDMVTAVHQLNTLFDLDLTKYPLDAPIPDLPITAGRGSRPHSLLELARKKKLTLRQLALHYGSLGHWILTGTPQDVADELEAFFNGDAADGFMIAPPYMTDALDDFIELVVPELQRRKLYRTAYEPGTLRDRLGLPEPAVPASLPPPLSAGG